MRSVVIRPRIQISILVAVFSMWTLLGVTYVTVGDVVAKRQWFGVVMGCLLIVSGLAGIWRALRLSVVINADGIRTRSPDRRDHVTPGVRSRRSSASRSAHDPVCPYTHPFSAFPETPARCRSPHSARTHDETPSTRSTCWTASRTALPLPYRNETPAGQRSSVNTGIGRLGGYGRQFRRDTRYRPDRQIRARPRSSGLRHPVGPALAEPTAAD